MATKKQQKAIKKAQKGKALKQSVKKFEHERYKHGSDHDLIPDPDATMETAESRMQVDGAGCFGGEAEMDSLGFKVRQYFLSNRKAEMTSLEIARAIGCRHAALKHPLALLVQQGILQRVRHPKHKVYKGGRSL